MRVSLAATVLPGLDLIGPLERSQSEVTVVRRAQDLAELLAAARSGLVDAVLVAGGAEHLTRAFLEELGRAPRPVGVLALTDAARERTRLRGLGVPCLPADVPPLALARAVQDAARCAAEGTAPGLGEEEDGRGGAHGAGDAGEPGPAQAAATGARQPGPATAAALDPALPPPPAAAWALESEALPEALADPGEARGTGRVDDGVAGSAPGRAEGTAEPDETTETTETTDPVEPGTPAGRPGPSGPTPGAEPMSPVSPRPGAPGRIVVVWGPTGAPGRTTVAVNLAAEYALAGLSTLVVDLDTYGPSVGVHLGLAEEAAGVAWAARKADRGRVGAADLAQAAVRVRVGGAALDVLTGLTRTDRWPELQRSAVEQVLIAARGGWDRVVVDVGFSLEEDEELSFDVPAPQRNAATLAALRLGDRVLAVGAADAVALPRLVRAVEELTGLIPAGAVQAVVNRVRPTASGTSPAAQVTAVWERYAPAVPLLATLPWDPVTADRALLAGQVLAEAAPGSALRRAVRALAEADGAAPASPPGRRRRLIPWSARSGRTR